jgi:hypothetical protein
MRWRVGSVRRKWGIWVSGFGLGVEKLLTAKDAKVREGRQEGLMRGVKLAKSYNAEFAENGRRGRGRSAVGAKAFSRQARKGGAKDAKKMHARFEASLNLTTQSLRRTAGEVAGDLRSGLKLLAAKRATEARGLHW